MQPRGQGGRWTPSEKVRAGSAAAGAGIVAAGLAVYFWTAGDLPVAAALAYAAVAATALGYRTLRGRRRRQRAAAPWIATGHVRSSTDPPDRPVEERTDEPAWLKPSPARASEARPPAPAVNDPWTEVKSEGERITDRMEKVEQLVKALFLLPVLVLSFAFTTGYLVAGEVLGTLVSAAVFIATCWFGRKFLSGDERFDVSTG